MRRKSSNEEKKKRKDSISRIPQLTNGSPRSKGQSKVTHHELLELIQKGDLETS